MIIPRLTIINMEGNNIAIHLLTIRWKMYAMASSPMHANTPLSQQFKTLRNPIKATISLIWSPHYCLSLIMWWIQRVPE